MNLRTKRASEVEMKFYDFTANLNNGTTVKMEEFKGKNVLIVNTASKCGFTPQYEGLQKIHAENDDLVVLGFPCNQFGGQEPGSDEEIQQFCDLNFSVNFPLFQKVEVNGDNTHPLFEYLKEQLPGLMGSKKVKWNFTKFLIDKDGNPVERFAPQTKPEDIVEKIKK